MKIQIASDLHLEAGGVRGWHSWTPLREDFRAAPGRDVLVLAGDIGVRDMHRGFVLGQADISPVVYVPGNHEYYTKQLRREVDAAWRRLAAGHPNLHYLVGETAEIGGVRFFGAPFYSNLGGAPSPWRLRDVEAGISDFDRQHSFAAPWTVREHLEAHAEQTAQLLAAAAEAPVDVVVTHWPPTRAAEAERFRGGPLSPYFVNDLDGLVEQVGAQAWISGHVHDPYDADIRGTRCIGNPRGYPSEYPPPLGFAPDKVIEIEGPQPRA